jgi:hypothetical protein
VSCIFSREFYQVDAINLMKITHGLDYVPIAFSMNENKIFMASNKSSKFFK